MLKIKLSQRTDNQLFNTKFNKKTLIPCVILNNFKVGLILNFARNIFFK